MKENENNQNNQSLSVRAEAFKKELFTNHWKSLLNFFMNNETEMKKFLSSVMYSINKIPNLLNDQPGLVMSILELAQIWLTPGLGWEAYILPYKGKATAMVGYQWFVKLLYETGISGIYSEIVYKNDVFKNIMWTNPGIIHEINPNHSKKDRWEPIWAYVVVKYKWENIFKYMNRWDILEFREYSQSYNWKWKDFSPWNEKNDPELNMWKKTVLKQMIKFLPKNLKLEKATEVDNKEAPFDAPREVEIWSIEEREKATEILEKITAEKLEK